MHDAATVSTAFQRFMGSLLEGVAIRTTAWSPPRTPRRGSRLGIGRGFLDQVQDHVPARPQPLADLEHELVAQHRRFFERLGLRGLHAARALLRALFLRNGRNRHEEAVGCDWGDIRPDLVGRHARIINPALASRLPRYRRLCSCPNVKGRHVSALYKDLGLRGLATRLPWDVAGSGWRRRWPRSGCSRAVRRA